MFFYFTLQAKAFILQCLVGKVSRCPGTYRRVDVGVHSESILPQVKGVRIIRVYLDWWRIKFVRDLGLFQISFNMSVTGFCRNWTWCMPLIPEPADPPAFCFKRIDREGVVIPAAG